LVAGDRPQTDVAITDKIYVKNHRQISAQLDASIPKSVFAGATLDRLFGGESLEKLDDATRDRVLAFAEDFLDCGCDDNPYCGHPQRKFMRYLLELRADGLGPDAIVDVMSDDYMVYAYSGDVRSFLDGGIRTLEAMETLARVEGEREAADRAKRERKALSGRR
jgi:superfamily II helicase